MKYSLALLLGLGLLAQNRSTDLCLPSVSSTTPALPARIMTGQGTVHFPITTSNPKAQEFFNQGIAQLHSFWATEAERSFRQAAELDPLSPMPWFGVAMVSSGDYRPRFQIDLLSDMFTRNPRGSSDRARQAAEKSLELANAPGSKITELERMYVAAAAARRLPGGKDPNDAYIAGLRAILVKYPGEVEAATFLALHLMRGYELPSKTPRPGTMEAVELLRRLAKTAPDHPGVHHYIIHGWEGSSFAKDAWESCRRYAELVPNIPHALHMPGHIYAQTGRVEDAIKAFSDAAANELGYMKADKLYSNSHHGHNVHFQSTTLGIGGRYAEAKDAAQSLLAFGQNPREKAAVDAPRAIYRQGWFAMLRSLVLAEAWNEIVEGTSLPADERPREASWRHWAVSVAQAAQGRTAEARAEAQAMDAALDRFTKATGRKIPAELAVARQELDGHIAASAGDTNRALKILNKAAKKQRALMYSEPPHYPRPVAIAAAEVARKAGRIKEAEAAFRLALEEWPGWDRAQAGLRSVSETSGVGGH